MTKTYVNVGVPKALAEGVDQILKQTTLGFRSRGEVVRHVLTDYLLELVRQKVLPPEILRKLQ